MAHQHLHMATHVDNYPGEVAVLRECLVRICDGNHCAAMMLDFFYERTLILEEVRAHEQRYSHEPISISVTTSLSDLDTLMCGLFDEQKMNCAFTLLLEKGYIYNHETWDDLFHFDVDTRLIDRIVVAIREKQYPTQKAPSQAPSAPAPKVVDEHAIYALVDPRDNTIRYIGMSRNAQNRYRQHLTCSGTNLLKNMWVVNLLQQGLQPALTIIETVDGLQAARDCETLWINHYLVQGAPLTNWNQNEALRNGYAGTRIDDPELDNHAQEQIAREVRDAHQ